MTRANSQYSAIKDEVSKVLSCALQADSDVQRLSQERKKALEMTDEYSDILIDIISENEEATAEKIMAAIFLKSYIDDTYYKNRTISANPSNRQKLIHNMLQLLTIDKIVVRKIISTALVSLAVREYPLFWDMISSKIKEWIIMGSSPETYCATQFMKDLFCDETSSHTHYFSQDFIPLLLQVFRNDLCETDLRCSSLQCIIFLFESAAELPEFDHLNAEISSQFQDQLSQPHSYTNDFKLKAEIILKISYLIYRLGAIKTNLIVNSCLPAVGEILFKCSVEHRKVMLQRSPVPRDQDELYEEPRHFKSLIINILYLIDMLLENDAFRPLIANELDNLIYYLVSLLYLHQDCDEVVFSEDENIKEAPCDIIIRETSVNTLISTMNVTSLLMFYQSLKRVMDKVLEEAELARIHAEQSHYRILEVVMYVLGLFSENSHKCALDPEMYIRSWTYLLNIKDLHWTVLGRLLWVGSRYANLLSVDLIAKHLEIVLVNYRSTCTKLRNACVVALRNHLKAAAKEPNRLIYNMKVCEVRDIILHTPDVINHLPITFAQLLLHLIEVNCCLTSGAYLPPNLKAHEVAPANMGHSSSMQLQGAPPGLALLQSDKLRELIITLITKHLWNVDVLTEVKSIIKKLCTFDDSKVVIIMPLIFYMGKYINRNRCNPPGVVAPTANALEILNTLIKHMPHPIPDTATLETFATVHLYVTESDDNQGIQIATSLAANILMNSSMSVQCLTDSKGKLLGYSILEMLYKLMEGNSPHFLGKLGRFFIISLMVLPEQFQIHMEPLIKALLSSLQRCEDTTSTKNMCLILSYMFIYSFSDITSFMCNIPGPDGKSALSYFLKRLIPTYVAPASMFETRIFTVALCKMIEHSIIENDLRINSIRTNVEVSYQTVELSGLEYLYYLLILILDNELGSVRRERHDTHVDLDDDEDLLMKNHPILELNVIVHIVSFLRNFDTIYYNNVVRNLKKGFIHQLETLDLREFYD